jgi:hypothetical protein
MNSDQQRLYSIYKTGSYLDGRTSSNLLTIALDIGDDLTEAEFASIASEVERIEKQFGEKSQIRERMAAMRAFRDESVKNRNVAFRPTRTKDNQPIFDAPGQDVDALADRLKGLSLDEVSHNSKLRNAWHAAQSGTLADFVSSSQAGSESTSTVQDLLSAFSSPMVSVPAGSPDQDTPTAAQFAERRKNVIQGKYDGKSGADILNQWKAEWAAEESGNGPGSQPTGQGPSSRSFSDTAQIGLDALGVVDPSPFTDLTNTIFSLIRALTDPSKSSAHLMNAGLSFLGVIPGFGDIAKIAKNYGSGGNPVSNFISNIANSSTGKNILAGAGGAGGGGGGIGRLLGAMGLPGGGLNPAMLLPGVLSVSVWSLKKFNEWLNQTVQNGRKQVESWRELALYSGVINLAITNYNANSQRLEQERAAFLAPSIQKAIKQQERLENEAQNFNLPWERLATELSSFTTALNAEKYKWLSGDYMNPLMYFDPTNPIGSLTKQLELLQYALDQIIGNANDATARNELEEAIRRANLPLPPNKLPAGGNLPPPAPRGKI